MDSFEQAFSDTERAAISTQKSATALVNLAKQLQKAAKEGNITAIKRLQDRFNSDLDVLRQEVANAVKTWPFKDEEEEKYLSGEYTEELRSAAEEKGLAVHERDGRLISHPSIVRVLPSDRAVRIDRKQTSNIRPSHLVDLLLANQKKPARYPSARFLEALYNVYSDIVKESSSDRMLKDSGQVVSLERIYKLFTSLPGSQSEYNQTDFARDLYVLDANGPKHTRKGATVDFPSSTGARRARGLFEFVGPDGRSVAYYGIRFTGGT